ncbi:MAG: ferrous iron transport protein, partial [Bacteroidota bacterium]
MVAILGTTISPYLFFWQATLEVENLKRNLLLFTQIKDLEIPTILVINMADRMALKGIELDISILEKELKTKIALI